MSWETTEQTTIEYLKEKHQSKMFWRHLVFTIITMLTSLFVALSSITLLIDKFDKNNYYILLYGSIIVAILAFTNTIYFYRIF